MKIKDKITGRKYDYIDIHGGKAIRPYVTQQHWSADSTGFVVGNDETQQIYFYNIITDTLELLDECSVDGSADAVITPENIMFYRKPNDEIHKIDLSTGEKQKIADKPEGAYALGVIHATHDGKYITSYWKEEKAAEDFCNGKARVRIVPRLTCETGEWDTTSLHHEFNDDDRYPDVGHPIINPVYSDLVFFCHEGRTEDIPDRLWIGNFKTGESKNLFKQAEREDGRTGETSGHEVWSFDGEELFFIKYTRAENLGQSGIVKVSKDGNKREYINGDYLYWHCYPSVDKCWVVADTQLSAERAEIVLVSTKTLNSYLLCNFWAPKYLHPYQPHPVISPNGLKVSWQMVDEDGLLKCAWMDISDIVNQKIEEEVEIAKNVSLITHRGTDSEVQKTSFNGEECYRVPYKNAMYLKTDKISKSGNITLKIEYLDWSAAPIQICYTSKPNTNFELANREDCVIEIKREDSIHWKTETISVENANPYGVGKYNSSFKIQGYFTEVYIKKIEVL